MKRIIQAFKNTLIAICLILMLQSCSHKSSFLNSSVVPAAEGKVKVRNDRNNNYVIDLEVIRLAEPDRLSPPKSLYIVWMKTPSGEMKNIGQLKSSSGFMSRTLKSSLETVTSYEPSEIIITAENDPTPTFPGSVVLRTGILETY